jgi:hypothetical protein
VAFARSYALSAPAEVALEDFARALTGASSAEAITGGGEQDPVRGVHLCEPRMAADGAAREDLEAFARDLAGAAGHGLGWS